MKRETAVAAVPGVGLGVFLNFAFFHAFFHFTTHIVFGIFEFADTFTKTTHELRDFFTAEKEQYNGSNKDKFGHA